jgi:hypothetical protein
MGALQLAAMPPRWTPESGRDLYYWYVGSMAAFQVGGDTWRLWNEALGKIEQFQCKGGAAEPQRTSKSKAVPWRRLRYLMW